nr:cytochrome P450 [uncultured Rhodoferax sp.]
MTGLETQESDVEAATEKRANPLTQSIPVFDTSSNTYQRFGLLALTEMAARQGGDAVLLRLAGGHDALLLSGAGGADHYARHVADIPSERGDVSSNAAAVCRLLGDSELAEDWRRGSLSIDGHLPLWLERARTWATAALLHDALHPQSSDRLRVLCRLWSVRACCPALLGHGLAEPELIEGFLRIEAFFAAMSSVGPQPAGADLEEAFKQARAFVDEAIAAGLRRGSSGDSNAVCALRALLPSSCSTGNMIDELRPVIFGLLFEAIQIDGLNLLWTLVELARDGALVEAIAMERRIDGAVRAGPLARAVAMEALRLYPELPFIHPTGPTSNVDDGELHRKTIIYAPWLIHRDARLWPEPTRFKPQRFLSSAENCHLPDIYMPFGLGPVARKRTLFVIDQIAATVATICRNAYLSIAPDCRPGNLRPVFRTTLQPRGDFDIHWQRRSNEYPAPLAHLETEKSGG